MAAPRDDMIQVEFPHARSLALRRLACLISDEQFTVRATAAPNLYLTCVNEHRLRVAHVVHLLFLIILDGTVDYILPE